MNVLSLCDGISGAMIALQQLGFKPDKYFASEIDKHAEGISMYNYPDIIRLGDIHQVSFFGLPKIDLLIAGFPCPSFSFAGNQKGFDDPRGQIFFQVIRIINEVKPKLFILENTRMKNKFMEIINSYVGFEPQMINSDLVSAQHRRRNYWVGRQNKDGSYSKVDIPEPNDEGIFLKDIITQDFDEKLIVNKKYTKFVLDPNRLQKKYTAVSPDKALTQTARQYNSWTGTFLKIPVGNVNPSGKGINGMVHHIEGKSDTLTTNKSEGPKITGASIRGRYLDGTKTQQVLECNNKEQSNALTCTQKTSLVIYQLPRGFNKGGVFINKSPTLSTSSWQDNNHLVVLDHYNNTLLASGKSKTITTNPQLNSSIGGQSIIYDGLIRKLSPIECERLQTYPDDFTRYALINGKVKELANSPRYKAIGNGFTAKVIAHILYYVLKTSR